MQKTGQLVLLLSLLAAAPARADDLPTPLRPAGPLAAARPPLGIRAPDAAARIVLPAAALVFAEAKASALPVVAAPPVNQDELIGVPAAPVAPAGSADPATCAPVSPEEADQADSDDDEADEDDGTAATAEASDGESEDHSAAPIPPPPGVAVDHLYSGDLSDRELARLWKEDRARLGTVAVGFTDAGRLINAKELPKCGPWIITVPEKDWGTEETIEYLTSVFYALNDQYPGGPLPRINGISKREGGYALPHRSHQTGRDVDIGFYYREVAAGRWARYRGASMDLPRDWALIRDLVTMTDVQMILVDRRIQKVLYDYALSVGEDRRWLDSLFHAGAASLIKHARHHRDHFHVRFFNGRAQELGRRVQPLLAKDPEARHVVQHRIARGDSLGRIARRYGTTVSAIKAANGLRSNALRAGRFLAIPLRGPCTSCPVPPPVVIPQRRLPPARQPPAVSARDNAATTLASR